MSAKNIGSSMSRVGLGGVSVVTQHLSMPDLDFPLKDYPIPLLVMIPRSPLDFTRFSDTMTPEIILKD